MSNSVYKGQLDFILYTVNELKDNLTKIREQSETLRRGFSAYKGDLVYVVGRLTCILSEIGKRDNADADGPDMADFATDAAMGAIDVRDMEEEYDFDEGERGKYAPEEPEVDDSVNNMDEYPEVDPPFNPNESKL